MYGASGNFVCPEYPKAHHSGLVVKPSTQVNSAFKLLRERGLHKPRPQRNVENTLNANTRTLETFVEQPKNFSRQLRGRCPPQSPLSTGARSRLRPTTRASPRQFFFKGSILEPTLSVLSSRWAYSSKFRLKKVAAGFL